MENSLASWLSAHGIKAYHLANELGLANYTVYRLLGQHGGHGPKDDSFKMLYINMNTLKLISAYTGIPIGVLAEDACQANKPRDEDTAVLIDALTEARENGTLPPIVAPRRGRPKKEEAE